MGDYFAEVLLLDQGTDAARARDEQAVAGEGDHLPFDRAQAAPPAGGAGMLAAAALRVADGRVKRQPGSFPGGAAEFLGP